MKIKSLTGAPPFGPQFGPASSAALTLNSPLVLTGAPTGPLQAATKAYVDNRATVIDATQLTTGTLPFAAMPSLVGIEGDFVYAGRNKILSVAPKYRTSDSQMVVTGVWTKYEVNAKGQVTDYFNLTGNDIPNLSWEKIVANRPTTTAGYGITDALAKTGGTLSNFLTLTNAPGAPMHAVNKSYADTRSASIQTYVTGDISVRPTTTTPSGFLRCNGGELTKTAYNALYAVVGDAFSNYTQPGNGQPWRQQSEINSLQSGSISWGSHSGLGSYPGQKTGVVLKNRVYLYYVGNTYSGGLTNTINSDGTISTTWTSGGLPLRNESRLYVQSLVIKNRLHFIGGFNNGVGGRADTISAPINADGTITNAASWVNGPALPVGIYNHCCVYTKDRVYILGGESSGTLSTVYTSAVNSDGTLAGFTTASPLPNPITNFCCGVVKNRLYIFGGYNSSTGTNYANVYYAPINSDGTIGAWVAAAMLPSASSDNEVLVVKNKVYLFVGSVNGTRSAAVYSAPVNADGSLGTWVVDSSLPASLGGMFIFGTSSKVYMTGSVNNNSPYSCYAGTFFGGVNDFSPYYNGSVLPTASTNFRLPDYTSQEKNGMNYFVKT